MKPTIVRDVQLMFILMYSHWSIQLLRLFACFIRQWNAYCLITLVMIETRIFFVCPGIKVIVRTMLYQS